MEGCNSCVLQTLHRIIGWGFATQEITNGSNLDRMLPFVLPIAPAESQVVFGFVSRD